MSIVPFCRTGLIPPTPPTPNLLYRPQTVSNPPKLIEQQWLCLFCVFLDRRRYLLSLPPVPLSLLAASLVPVRKKGITSILLTSFANISQQNHNNNNNTTATNHATNVNATAGAGSTGKEGVSFFPDSAATGPNKTRKNDFYIGNEPATHNQTNETIGGPRPSELFCTDDRFSFMFRWLIDLLGRRFLICVCSTLCNLLFFSSSFY